MIYRVECFLEVSVGCKQLMTELKTALYNDLLWTYQEWTRIAPASGGSAAQYLYVVERCEQEPSHFQR